MPSREANILILCKTYPSPSIKYTETSCVAGMEEDGSLIRLYPVPFRLVNEKQQFRKWQWIRARVEKSPNDHRPESHRIFVDTIRTGTVVDTGRQRDWAARRSLISRLPIYESHADLEQARINHQVSLGLVRVTRVTGLDITPHKSPDWTSEELSKLAKAQASLFEEDEASIRQLEKIPFDFHYRYECETPTGTEHFRHKIVDWEACQLYRNLVRSHGRDGWQEPFKRQLLHELPKKDLLLLQGTIHRFPGQWLIVSLIYPPKERQQSLF
ncbi:MAG: hypothetical protein ACRC3F_09465 [Billgrantia desiderata]